MDYKLVVIWPLDLLMIKVHNDSLYLSGGYAIDLVISNCQPLHCENGLIT